MLYGKEDFPPDAPETKYSERERKQAQKTIFFLSFWSLGGKFVVISGLTEQI